MGEDRILTCATIHSALICLQDSSIRRVSFVARRSPPSISSPLAMLSIDEGMICLKGPGILPHGTVILSWVRHFGTAEAALTLPRVPKIFPHGTARMQIIILRFDQVRLAQWRVLSCQTRRPDLVLLCRPKQAECQLRQGCELVSRVKMPREIFASPYLLKTFH